MLCTLRRIAAVHAGSRRERDSLRLAILPLGVLCLECAVTAPAWELSRDCPRSLALGKRLQDCGPHADKCSSAPHPMRPGIPPLPPLLQSPPQHDLAHRLLSKLGE